MPRHSKVGISRLATSHRDIQTIMMEVVKVRDCTVVECQRTAERQHEHWQKGRKLIKGSDPKRRNNWHVINKGEVVTYKDGYEKKSRHQGEPRSKAIDVVPYPEMWGDPKAFKELSGVIKAVQDVLYEDGLIMNKLEWGFDLWGWDAPHWQMMR